MLLPDVGNFSPRMGQPKMPVLLCVLRELAIDSNFGRRFRQNFRATEGHGGEAAPRAVFPAAPRVAVAEIDFVNVAPLIPDLGFTPANDILLRLEFFARRRRLPPA